MEEVYSIENEDALKETLVRIVKDMTPTDNKATVLGFVGELGAGKTTSAQLLGRYFGVQSTMQSPTFVIERTYAINWNGFTTLAHLDMYRLSEGELPTVKLHERLADEKTFIIIEWADVIKNSLPSDTHWITLLRKEGEKRELRYRHG